MAKKFSKFELCLLHKNVTSKDSKNIGYLNLNLKK